MKASDPLKLCIASVLLQIYETKAGSVVISPPGGVAPACSGDLLELTCTTLGSFAEWSFFLIPEQETTARKFACVLHIDSVPASSELLVNSITFIKSFFFLKDLCSRQPATDIKATD